MIDPETGEIVSSYVRFSAERSELFAALAKAQAKFEAAEKAGTNPHFRSKYMTLSSVIDAFRQPLSENGLCLMQPPGNAGTAIAVTTILGHTSGQWCESVLSVAPVKFDAQSVGSVITYLRRYAAASMLGIAPDDDDDGNAAVEAPAANGRTATKAAPAAETPSPAKDAATAAYKRLAGRIDAGEVIYDFETGHWVSNCALDVAAIKDYRPSVLRVLTARLAEKMRAA